MAKGWNKKETMEQRFNRQTEREGSCVVWTGYRNQYGYGRLVFKGRLTLAHRFSYEMKFGPIPKGKVIAHKCDNRACVNLSHLFLATQQENIKDTIKKRRHNFGENNGRAFLKESDVLEIRRLVTKGKMTHLSISKRFGICRQTVGDIMTGKSWSHL